MTTSHSSLVWLASYPKSGNTWVRVALCSMQSGGKQIDLGGIARFAVMPTTRRQFDRLLEVDAGELSQEELEVLRPALHDALAAIYPKPQLLKVHDRWQRTTSGRAMFDRNHTYGAIYIVRDPRDVAISWAHFCTRSIDWSIGFLSDPDAVVSANPRRGLPNVAQKLGRWSDHVASWIDDSCFDPLVIRYEDLHADFAGTLNRMGDYLGWTSSPEAIDGAKTASAFDRLAAQEEAGGFGETPDSASQFFVSGKAGRWRDVLTRKQASQIERDHEPVMHRLGYL